MLKICILLAVGVDQLVRSASIDQTVSHFFDIADSVDLILFFSHKSSKLNMLK